VGQGTCIRWNACGGRLIKLLCDEIGLHVMLLALSRKRDWLKLN
jgi:hypothetical protein